MHIYIVSPKYSSGQTDGKEWQKRPEHYLPVTIDIKQWIIYLFDHNMIIGYNSRTNKLPDLESCQDDVCLLAAKTDLD